MDTWVSVVKLSYVLVTNKILLLTCVVSCLLKYCFQVVDYLEENGVIINNDPINKVF